MPAIYATPWKKPVAQIEVDNFVRKTAADMASLPAGKAAGDAMLKTLAAFTPSGWIIAAGAYRDFPDLPQDIRSRAHMLVNPAVSLAFQRSYLAGKWEGAREAVAEGGIGIGMSEANLRNVSALTAQAIRSAAGSSTRGTASTSREEQAAPAAPDPVTTFNAMVESKIKAGVDRQRAVADVVKEYPNMHAAYLAAHRGTGGKPPANSAAPVASGGEDPIAAFRAAVAAKRPTVKTDAEAIAAVVKAQPDLHRAFLDAMNQK